VTTKGTISGRGGVKDIISCGGKNRGTVVHLTGRDLATRGDDKSAKSRKKKKQQTERFQRRRECQRAHIKGRRWGEHQRRLGRAGTHRLKEEYQHKCGDWKNVPKTPEKKKLWKGRGKKINAVFREKNANKRSVSKNRGTSLRLYKLK